MYWYNDKGQEKDIFVSSRVRLARNLCDYPFYEKLDPALAAEIIERLKGDLEGVGGYRFTDFCALAENDRIAMVEKNLASREMLRKKLPSAIVENEEENVTILLCEEDHIRIQSILSGLDLFGAYERACRAERLIDSKEKLAFSEKLGYLTHCPTNLGTGMRASVMMFLPMLSATGRMRGLEASLSKIGLTVRGVRGEGSTPLGDLYQISNRVTLGVSEEEILENLLEAVNAIAREERTLRKEIRDSEDIRHRDRIMRSFGACKYAFLVDTDELYRLYSDIRLGICLGYIEGLSEKDADNMLVECMAANLYPGEDGLPDALSRDKKRAEKLKELIKG